MRIAINTRFLLPGKMEGFGWYTYEITKRLVEQHPEHTFILLFDRPFDPKFVFGPNAIPVVLKPQARHPILFYIWFEFSVRKALKKYKADLFFSPDGYVSLRSNIPQLATIHDINFEHYPEDIPFSARKYLKHFFPKFARKASKIITVSNFSKQDLITTYGIPETKIKTSWNGASDRYHVLDEPSKIPVRERYTQGQKYFLFVGSIHPRKNLPRLLQAFQLYKQKYPEGFDLLIVGTLLWKNKTIETSAFENIKEQVHFSGHLSLDELVKVTASASCITYVPYFEGFGIPLVEAMKCGIPIISGNKSSLPEVIGDAGLLVDPFSVTDIAAAMEKMYLDPALAESYGQKALDRSTLFSWDQSAESVWQSITEILD